MQDECPDHYTLGICAMDKKARSKPMDEILRRLPQAIFTVVYFGDDMILNTPVEQWPICDSLIAFCSGGFPLEKVQEYVKLRNPVTVNDLEKQKLLLDRRDVYRTLQENNIPVPRHVFVNRDLPEGKKQTIVEADDYIEVDGIRIDKPFVEKPINGEDHNIHIYYPMSAGGGCKRLFRKIGNRSSEFHKNENHVRTKDSYIYEEFLSTQGTDVKVYTVGPNYAHAEARKSPVLDGKVLRDKNGKEVRYPVILNQSEKEMARKVCATFEQTVCGFDILRVHGGKSFVCDVNGWSFVKNSEKYYDDCAILLTKFLTRAMRAHLRGERKAVRSVSLDLDEMMRDSMTYSPSRPTTPRKSLDGTKPHEELRCVLAVIRHGDRDAKQKMKMSVSHQFFLDYYHQRASSPKADLKIKAVNDLKALLSVAKNMLQLYDNEDPKFMTYLHTREQDHNEDINDKIKGLHTICDVLERWQLCGINRKVQLKPRKWKYDANGNMTQAESLLLILKWGGDLTTLGMEQAETLGRRFREKMYPGADDGGLIRLHSTYRHDLKIYTSDEGRVQKTAAAFAKGFLQLEGDLIPILISLVAKGKDKDLMLDQSGTSAKDLILCVKERLHDLLHRGDDCSSLKKQSESDVLRTVAAALDMVEQPMKKMEKLFFLLGKLSDHLKRMTLEPEASKMYKPYGGETIQMMLERWAKLYRDFFSAKKNTYDLSKIPDIHDCSRYDIVHNRQLHLTGLDEVLHISKDLSHAIVPQEYGINEDEKVEIGIDMCHSLLQKIVADLLIAQGYSTTYMLNPNFAKDVKSAHRSVRTRLYFTSESHIHTLLNVLRFAKGDLPSPIAEERNSWISSIPELCYMTHIVIRVFERFEMELDDPNRYRIEIMLSPGVNEKPIETSVGEKPVEVDECEYISEPSLTCQDLQDYLYQAISRRSKPSDEDTEAKM